MMVLVIKCIIPIVAKTMANELWGVRRGPSIPDQEREGPSLHVVVDASVVFAALERGKKDTLSSLMVVKLVEAGLVKMYGDRVVKEELERLPSIARKRGINLANKRLRRLLKLVEDVNDEEI